MRHALQSTVYVAFLCLFLSSCAATDTDMIAAANDAMRSEIRDGSIISIDANSEKLFEPSGNVYYVCGSGVMDSHVIDAVMNISHAPRDERFIITANKSTLKGFGMFDGTSDPDLRASFQEEWNRECPSYVLNVPTP